MGYSFPWSCADTKLRSSANSLVMHGSFGGVSAHLEPTAESLPSVDFRGLNKPVHTDHDRGCKMREVIARMTWGMKVEAPRDGWVVNTS